MSKIILNIIHLNKELFDPNSDLYNEAISRNENILLQTSGQNVAVGFNVWPGIIVQGLPYTGISRSYKQVVQDAKNKGLEYVAIADDDFTFTSRNSWMIFKNNIPSDFDVYLAGISGGVVDEQTTEVHNWSGTFLFIVHSRFYDVFLAADEAKNIDRWLSGSGLENIEQQLGRKPIYKVCYPIVAICKDGISYNSKGEDGSPLMMKHDKYFDQYKKYQ
jgi:hypothetical protein